MIYFLIWPEHSSLDGPFMMKTLETRYLFFASVLPCLTQPPILSLTRPVQLLDAALYFIFHQISWSTSDSIHQTTMLSALAVL